MGPTVWELDGPIPMENRSSAEQYMGISSVGQQPVGRRTGGWRHRVSAHTTTARLLPWATGCQRTTLARPGVVGRASCADTLSVEHVFRSAQHVFQTQQLRAVCFSHRAV